MNSFGDSLPLVWGIVFTYLLHSTAFLTICWMGIPLLRIQSLAIQSALWKSATIMGLLTTSLVILGSTSNDPGFDQPHLHSVDLDDTVTSRIQSWIDAQNFLETHELPSQLVPSFLSSRATPKPASRSRMESPVA